MKVWIAALLMSISLVVGAASKVVLEPVELDLNDKASLARGALFYIEHCLGCHSVKYIRYEAINKDFGVPEDQVKQRYIHSDQKLVDPIVSAMPGKDANKWFGTETPDLSLTARSRGTAWIYHYLHGFYRDDSRTHGVNNLVYHNVAMPNVLYELQGDQILIEQGDGTSNLELVKPGSMSVEEFDQSITDLVNFLYYASEPHRLERYSVGRYVVLFLLIFSALCYFLKKTYWQRIH